MGGAPEAATALKLSDQSVPASHPTTSANPTASAPASNSSNSRRLRPRAHSAKAMSTSVHAINRS
jgi:type IV secretory pathway TrbL component